MTEQETEARIFVSGESVSPGDYLDLETGAIIRVLQPDALPHRERVVQSPRLFLRLDAVPQEAEDFALRS